MRSALNYGVGFIILLTAGILYERWREKDEMQQKIDDYELIKQYLITESVIAKCEKPILWVPLEFAYNARYWQSFGSRSSMCMNKPYFSLCIRSIIEKNSDDFQVCLIDDATFNKIIPGWTTQIENLPDPIKQHMRYLALCKTLYYYGGMVLPPSLICLKNMYAMYSIGLSKTEMFSCELISRSNVSSITTFFPSMKIMGCVKESIVMESFINYLETAVSGDYTSELEFTGGPEKWLYNAAKDNKLLIVNGNLIGVKDIYGKPVALESLLGDIDIKFSKKMRCIYIPADELTLRTSYNWFDRLSAKQVLQSDTLIGKYLLASNGRFI